MAPATATDSNSDHEARVPRHCHRYDEALLSRLLLPESSLVLTVLDLDFDPVTNFFKSISSTQLGRLLGQQGNGALPSDRSSPELSIELHFTVKFLHRCAARQPLDSATTKAMWEWEHYVQSVPVFWMHYKCGMFAKWGMANCMKDVLAMFEWKTPAPVHLALNEKEHYEAVEMERCDLGGHTRKAVVEKLKAEIEQAANDCMPMRGCGTGRCHRQWRVQCTLVAPAAWMDGTGS
ncbi:hypothetical protein LTR95_004129 [Oleoguttula sp. CCFEE 5521]